MDSGALPTPAASGLQRSVGVCPAFMTSNSRRRAARRMGK